MNKLVFLLITTTILTVVSCNGSDENENENRQETIDTLTTPTVDTNNSEAEFTAADTSSTGVYQEKVNENDGNSLQNALQSDNKQEVVAGGMSFCDCVKKQKELEKIMVETDDDAKFDKAMADMSAMKTGECKILFAGKQNTIEDKQAHERKVKRCLGK